MLKRYERTNVFSVSLAFLYLFVQRTALGSFIQGTSSLAVRTNRSVSVSHQKMWDPEKGSIMGQNIPISSHQDLTKVNETVQVGSNAFLDCLVRNMADKKVSWIRRRDNHILTSGRMTYANDGRFSVVRSEDSNNWALLIRYVQSRDQGRYECQVSTKTGGYGYVVNLHVVVPKASIVGPTTLHVQSGSNFSLLCLIKEVITPPQYVFWYHNSKVINYEQSRGEITVQTNLTPNPNSRIAILGAQFQHSGNYSCQATDADLASVSVFVSEGDKTAAIQRLGSGESETVSKLRREIQIILCFLNFATSFLLNLT